MNIFLFLISLCSALYSVHPRPSMRPISPGIIITYRVNDPYSKVISRRNDRPFIMYEFKVIITRYMQLKSGLKLIDKK